MTLKDIAREAGVSTATVSNVINGNHSKVSAANIERIQALIHKHNYIPNAFARNLAAKTTQMIGVIISGEVYGGGNPHNAVFIDGLEKAIKSHGYYLLLHCSDTMESAITTLTMWDVDGAVILGYLDPDMEAVLEGSRRNFPIVLVDSYMEKTHPNSMVVSLNDYRGGYIAGKYLISYGHRNLAFIGATHRSSGVILQRLHGFKNALAEQGITLKDSAILDFDVTFEEGVLAGKELCKMNFERGSSDRITAVFASSDIVAVGIIEGVNLSGASVPKDLSVIGFDNINLCKLTTPKLTTIGQDIKRKAELAANLLIDTICGTQSHPLSTIIEPELIERQSVWRIM